jgi:NAD(P)-dependent dehydrogenase (short-subunit alcohol dehydrogenase family)
MQEKAVKPAGRTALITGGAKRLGREIALTLAGRGMNIVLHYHTSGAAAAELAQRISRIGVKAHIVKGDLADISRTDELMNRAIKAAGKIDILINNAAIYGTDQFSDLLPADLETSLRVNALSPLLLARTFAVHARGAMGGNIINLLDCRIRDYNSSCVSYSLSKKLLSYLTEMMAVEFAPQIRVNGVAPGIILPEPGKGSEYIEKLKLSNPLEKWGSSEDVTRTVLFLLDSNFITGQVIFIDGGRSLQGSAND